MIKNNISLRVALTSGENEKKSSKMGKEEKESEADGQRQWHHARGNKTAAQRRN